MSIWNWITEFSTDAMRWSVEAAAGSASVRMFFLFLLRHLAGIDVREVGKVLELKLDSKAGRLTAKVELKGEERPLVIEEIRFKIHKANGKANVEILSVQTDREWMNGLASLALPKTIEAPEKLSTIIGILA